MASVPHFPSSSFTFYFLFLFFTAWSMHHSSSVNYSSSCIVAAFLIYAIQVYLSVITCPPKSKEAHCLIPRKLLASLHCPLSLEGCQSLCEYCPSSLSRTLGTLWYASHNKASRISLVPPPQVKDLSQPSQVTPGGHALACPFTTNTMIQ